jgi:acyl-CoA thioester hydrolase
MVGERGTETSCGLVVRWYECDTYGHVNNAVYLHYLEFAREHYMRELGISFNEMRASGVGLYVARISVDYKRPALPEDMLTVLTRPLKRSRIGGILGQKVMRGETLIAQAEVTWVSVNAQGRPTPLPPAFDREGLSP